MRASSLCHLSTIFRRARSARHLPLCLQTRPWKNTAKVAALTELFGGGVRSVPTRTPEARDGFACFGRQLKARERGAPGRGEAPAPQRCWRETSPVSRRRSREPQRAGRGRAAGPARGSGKAGAQPRGPPAGPALRVPEAHSRCGDRPWKGSSTVTGGQD